jgi:hypothetical protein
VADFSETTLRGALIFSNGDYDRVKSRASAGGPIVVQASSLPYKNAGWKPAPQYPITLY